MASTVSKSRPINFKLISRVEQDGNIISVFEAPTALKDRRYHFVKTVTPHGEYQRYSVI